MPEIQERKKESKSVEISFGTVFKVKNYDKFSVITDIGEEDYFGSCTIMYNKKGEVILGFEGTHGPIDIDEIVDQWNKERVFAAYSRFYGRKKDHKDYFKSEHYKVVKKSSEKGSRMLDIPQ